MGLRSRIINALGGVEKPQKNSMSGREFLMGKDRYKGNDVLYPTWDEIKINDSDLYKGYSYAVIQKRGNKVASLARENITTWVNDEALDIFQKKEATPLHPYLKLIEDSDEFTEKRFWKDISIYLDLCGVYYLGVVRNIMPSRDKEKFPDLYSTPTKFIMLNPYEIRRIVNSDGEVAGYVERKKDGRERIWGKHQIIEMRELNPFDDTKTWSMTDAAKDSVYTINQSGDYARQALNGNLDAPGIITTDVILEDEDFANFRERVRQHRRGEPIFGNGSGAITWTNTQVNLDQAALPSINEISRTTLFAVSGTSKTSLGIEQSGTTRETARVQNENFAQDTALPRLEDIIDYLNLDYKQKYKDEYKKIGYTIEVKSVSGTDYDTEQSATQVRQTQFTLAQDIIYAGYTAESARQYAVGEIDLNGLEEANYPTPKDDDDESNPPENPEGPQGPQEPQTPPTTDDTGENEELKKLEDIEPHADLKEGEETKNSPKELLEHHCCEDDEAPDIDFYQNKLTEEDGVVLDEAYNKLLNEIRKVQKEAIVVSIENIVSNAYDESDLVKEDQKKTLTQKLKNAFSKYWKVLFPLFGATLILRRNQEFGVDYSFKFTNELQEIADENGARVAEGHIDTVFKDILKVTNETYEQAVEKEAVNLIYQQYDENPGKYSAYFKKKPTKKQILSAIRNTDILDINRRIYERANKLATEGEARASIIKTIRKEYNHLSQERATMIARNETSRAFTHSQYDADYQFLNSIGKLTNAYKQLYSRSGNPCKACQAVIDMGPIPFTQNFVDLGGTVTYDDNGKEKNYTANYEAIKAGVLHPNCNCAYRLVFLDGDGKVANVYNSLWAQDAGNGDAVAGRWLNSHSNHTTKTLNGGKGSGNFGHSGREGKVGGSSRSGVDYKQMEKDAIALGDELDASYDSGYIDELTKASEAGGEIAMDGKYYGKDISDHIEDALASIGMVGYSMGETLGLMPTGESDYADFFAKAGTKEKIKKVSADITRLETSQKKMHEKYDILKRSLPDGYSLEKTEKLVKMIDKKVPEARKMWEDFKKSVKADLDGDK